MARREPSDLLRLNALLKRACDLYRQPFSEALAEAYSDALDGRPIEQIEQAAVAHFRASRFFPAPVDLLQVGGDGALRVEAGEDWALLTKGKPAKNSATIAGPALNLVGGYSMLRDLSVSDEPHRRREFIEAYVALAHEASVEEALHQLAESRRALSA